MGDLSEREYIEAGSRRLVSLPDPVRQSVAAVAMAFHAGRLELTKLQGQLAADRQEVRLMERRERELNTAEEGLIQAYRSIIGSPSTAPRPDQLKSCEQEMVGIALAAKKGAIIG